MFGKIWHKLSTTITGGAIIIAAFSVLSKLAGLFRDRLLASHFGAGDTLDIYYAAFRLPDLVFNTLILGAFTAAFIPVFIRYLKKDKEEAYEISNSVLNILLLVVGVLSILVIILADYLVPLLVPGFDEINILLTVRLTRIMFLSVIIFTFSNVLSGILNTFKRYLAFSMAPIFYNIGIIVGIIYFYRRPMGIDGLAWGVVLGSFLHMLVQLIAVYRTDWRYVPWLKWSHEGVKRIIKLMIPRTFALGVNQVNQVIMTAIASTLAIGSIAVFNLANNLQSLNVIGISFALSVFPVFSEALAENDHEKFKSVFSLNVRRILFIMIPISMLLFLLRAQLVRLILGTGAFDWEATISTAQTLGFFTMSLFAQSLIPLFVRAFYAMEDTKTPVLLSIATVILNIILAYTLSPVLGVAGLALAFSVASIVNFVLLIIWLRKKIGALDLQRIFISFIKIIAVSLAASGLAYITLHYVGKLVNMTTFLGVLSQAAAASVVAVVAYFSFSLIINLEETLILKKYLKKIFRYE